MRSQKNRAGSGKRVSCGSRKLLVFLLLHVIFCAFSWRLPAFAAPLAHTADRSMDVVLVIDISGSMKYTDPDQMAVDAAMLFLNMLEEEGCRVGILAFSDKVTTVRELEPVHMAADQEEIRNALTSLQREGDTDLGAASQAALQMLQADGKREDAAASKSAVLFFTDGAVDLPDEEAALDSIEQARAAARQAMEEGVHFYCIGLDDSENQSPYHLDREMLGAMAGAAGGTFRYVENASLLPDLFHLVFSDFIESRSQRVGDLYRDASGEASYVTFSIPDSSVLEANVIFIPAKSGADPSFAEDIILMDPQGETVDFTGKTARLWVSDSSALIKLMTPESGEWTLKAPDHGSYQVHVNLLLHYEIELECEVISGASGNTIDVTAFFVRRGERLMDPLLYEQFDCQAAIERERTPAAWEDGKNIEYMLLYDPEAACFCAQIPVYPGSSNTLTVRAGSEDHSILRAQQSFTSAGSDAIIVGRLPGSIRIEGMFPADARAALELGGVFSAWDQSAVSVDIESSDPDLFTCRRSEKDPETLILEGKKSGAYDLRIAAKDQYGNEAEKIIPVEITIHWEFWQKVLLAFIPVPLLCFLVLFIRRRGNLSPGGRLLLTSVGFSTEEGMEVQLSGQHSNSPLMDFIPSETDALQRMGISKEWIGIAREGLEDIYVYRSGMLFQKGRRLLLKNRGDDTRLYDCFGKETTAVMLQSGDTFELRFCPESIPADEKKEYFSVYGFYDGE